jgi:amidase
MIFSLWAIPWRTLSSVPAADAYAITADTTLNIPAAGVLTNDGDVEGDPPEPDPEPDPFARSLERDFKGARIAWSKDLGGRPIDAENSRVTESQRHVFENLGMIVEDDEPDLSTTDQIFQTIRAYIFAMQHETHLRDHRDKVKQTVIWNAEQGMKLSAAELGKAEQLRTELYQQLMKFFDKYEFLAMPVTSVPPFSIELEYPTDINGVELETYLDWMWPCYTISVTALPAISVPAGFTKDGLPVGLQLVGRPRDEMGLLQLASAFEGETNFYKQRPGVVN